MKHSEFMAAIADCYDSYKSPMLEQITFKFIKERFQESELEAVFGQLIIKVNPKYKTPPSPADFEELFFKKNTVDIEAQAKAAYAEISRYSTMHPAVFSDICSQGAVELMGGWSGFSKFNLDEAQIHRNTFCKYYKQLVDDPGGIIPKVLPGSGNWLKPKEPQLIGDKNKCLQITEAVNKNSAMKEIENMTGEMKSWQKQL